MPTRQTADYDPLMDELPPELAAEYIKEKRRRKISEAMLGQSQTPLVAPEVKGRFQGAISPFQGLAQVAKAYMANKGLEGSDAAMAGLGGRISEGRNAAFQNMTKAMTGTHEESLPNDVFGPPMPAVPGSIDAAMKAGMGSPYTRKFSQAMMLEKMKNQMKSAESPWAKVDPKDYTPESLATFGTTKSHADLRALAKPGKESDQIIQYEYAQTPKGGNFKGTFEQFKAIAPTITAAAMAALRAAQVGNINAENAYNLPPPRKAPPLPKPGEVVDGYKFKGGNPADQRNWEKR